MNLSRRSSRKERMDDPTLSREVLRHTHRQLRDVNVYTLGYWPTMEAMRHFFRARPTGKAMRILDIGCGDGETLRRIYAYGRLRGVPLQLTGMDLCPDAIAAARQSTHEDICFMQGDAMSPVLNDAYDVIISSLTTHHLSDTDIVRLMRWMTENAAVGWFICDLNRHAVAYHFIKYFTRMCRFNPLICHDAPLSVARAFRREDWSRLIRDAGLVPDQVKVTWYPNFRYGVRYERV